MINSGTIMQLKSQINKRSFVPMYDQINGQIHPGLFEYLCDKLSRQLMNRTRLQVSMTNQLKDDHAVY